MTGMMYRFVYYVLFWIYYCDVITAESARGCYGSGLTIACKTNARINILRDFYGYASGSGCNTEDDADCRLSITPHQSKARKQCNGVSECTLTVEHRVPCPSGLGQTNFHQIDFECIPDIYLNDVCHSKQWEAEGAYLVSPGYPSVFPSDTDCHCSVFSLGQSGSLAQVLTLDFDIASASPVCDNWVEFNVSGKEVKLCGRFTRRFSGRSMVVRFHSSSSARKGFLLYAYGRPKGTKLKLRCGSQNARSVDVVHGEDALFAARRMSLDARRDPTTITSSPLLRREPQNSQRNLDYNPWTDPNLRKRPDLSGFFGSAVRHNPFARSRPVIIPPVPSLDTSARVNLKRSDTETMATNRPRFPTPKIEPPSRDAVSANQTGSDVDVQSEDFSLVHGRLSFQTDGEASPTPPPRIVSACFGSTLDLHCGVGKIIRILDSFYGYSADGRCMYSADGCFRRPERGSGLAEQMCNTKTSCNSLHVSRVMCGESYTNYQQIAYECIPANIILDISDTFTGASSAGYLASPKFPAFNSFPVSVRCTLKTDSGNVRLQIIHLQLDDDGHCNNWLRLQFEQRTTTYCRPGSGTFVSQKIELSYRASGNSGVWLYFDAIGTAHVTVECNVDRPGEKRWSEGMTSDSPVSTTLPSVPLWGRASFTEVDVFGHVPEELAEFVPGPTEPTQVPTTPTVDNQNSLDASPTSTVSPFNAWQMSTPAGTSMRSETVDREMDFVSETEATRETDEGWTAADLPDAEYSLENFHSSSAPVSSNSQSYDFFQYEAPPDDQTDPLVTEVLKKLFDDSYLDELVDMADVDDDDVARLAAHQVNDDVMTIDNQTVSFAEEEARRLQDVGIEQKEEVTVAPPGEYTEHEEARDLDSAEYLERTIDYTPAETEDTSVELVNDENNTNDETVDNAAVPSDITADYGKPSDNYGTQNAIDDQPADYLSSWHYFDLDDYEFAPENDYLEAINQTYPNNTTAHYNDVVSAVYDVASGSAANKLNPRTDTNRQRHFIWMCLLLIFVTK